MAAPVRIAMPGCGLIGEVQVRGLLGSDMVAVSAALARSAAES